MIPKAESAINSELTCLVPETANRYFTYYHDYPIWYYRDSVGVPGPGFALSPLSLGALDEDGHYDPALLVEMLEPGRMITLSRR